MKQMHNVMQLLVHIPFEATLCQLTRKKGGAKHTENAKYSNFHDSDSDSLPV